MCILCLRVLNDPVMCHPDPEVQESLVTQLFSQQDSATEEESLSETLSIQSDSSADALNGDTPNNEETLENSQVIDL